MLGMLFMCAASALFPVMNGIVKLLAAAYEPTQIVWFRIVVHLGLVALVFTPRMGLDLFRTQRIGLQFLSSVMMLLSTLFFFSAVKFVGVAEAIAVSFVAPLAVVFLAWPLLGEKITALRVVAVVVGFAGVLLVIRPGSSVFQWASVLLLGSALCYAAALRRFPLLAIYAQPIQNIEKLTQDDPLTGLALTSWVLLLFAGFQLNFKIDRGCSHRQ